jgi:hypothetical protein
MRKAKEAKRSACQLRDGKEFSSVASTLQQREAVDD